MKRGDRHGKGGGEKEGGALHQSISKLLPGGGRDYPGAVAGKKGREKRSLLIFYGGRRSGVGKGAKGARSLGGSYSLDSPGTGSPQQKQALTAFGAKIKIAQAGGAPQRSTTTA